MNPTGKRGKRISPQERDRIVGAFKSGRGVPDVGLMFPQRSATTLESFRAIARAELRREGVQL